MMMMIGVLYLPELPGADGEQPFGA